MNPNDPKRPLAGHASLNVSALSRDLRTPPRPEGHQASLPLGRANLGEALRRTGSSPPIAEKQGQGDVGGGGGGPSVAHVKPMTNADGLGALADTDRKVNSRDRRYDSKVDSVMEAQSPSQAQAVKPQSGKTLSQALDEAKSQPKPDKPENGIPPRPRRRM